MNSRTNSLFLITSLLLFVFSNLYGQKGGVSRSKLEREKKAFQMKVDQTQKILYRIYLTLNIDWYIIRAFRKLTTQFNIEGDEYLWDDFAFATRDGLVATAVDVTDPTEIQRRGLDHAFKHITFNIELVKDAAAAPSTEVERRRASA